jgi:spore maturation protein CgeB
MKTKMPQLKRHLGYQKFQNPPHRFLFLKYDYFLQHQLLSEIRRQGHEAIELEIPRQLPAEEVLRLVLGKLVEFKPDALIALNNMGLDKQGIILGVLGEFTFPVIIWYLDNYRFTGPYLTKPAPETTIIFSSDKALRNTLEETGFSNAFYLPLATDITYSTIRYDDRYASLRDKVTYVGGTFSKMIKHFYVDVYEALYTEWQPDLTAIMQREGRISVDELFAPYQERFPNLESYYHFMAYVVFRETRDYRVGRLSNLVDEQLVVFGREDWSNYLPGEVLQPPVQYSLETPNVYRNSGINLSLTTFQQETALNQRLFDVPLCNGFVLTDWRESLADHFELDEEVVYFKNDEDLLEKVRYYLKNPSAREPIVQKARERILREHLMEHRVKTMLETVKDVLKR